MKKEITVNIEIPLNSTIKYEYDRSKERMKVDRIMREGFYYPANYGYVAEALDWDGDELDVLVYSPEKFFSGVQVQARVLGAMKMIDDGEVDTKLIAVHANDYRLENIITLADLPQEWLDKVQTFFENYKSWKRPDIVQINGFKDLSWAMKEYDQCVKLMTKYGKMPKKEFIKTMKQKHPEKYS